MAVIWRKLTRNKCYEVRRAGSSLRLYTNGVFHSQFNPRAPLAGHLWDLFLLPVLLNQTLPKRPQRVLLLGVGGGAVIRLIRALGLNCEVVGVELDPVHLHIARRFFNAQEGATRLVLADAVDWVRATKDGPFDVIIDDLFGEQGDGASRPERAVTITAGWVAALDVLLAPSGVLAFNLEGAGAAAELARICKTLKPVQQVDFSLSRYENVVAVILQQSLPRRQLMARLQASQAGQKLLKTLSCSHIYCRYM